MLLKKDLNSNKQKNPKKADKKLLLHICCVGCGVHISRELGMDHKISLFFYNPNIYPFKEYEKRAVEAERVAKIFKLNLITGEYDHKSWLKKVKGHELEPEKGSRCAICYEDRLDMTAKTAKKKNFDIFATTLSVSPHKDAELLNNLGRKLAKKYGLYYLDADFKKKDGFKKASALSKELGLYRQNYCGCEFSIF